MQCTPHAAVPPRRRAGGHRVLVQAQQHVATFWDGDRKKPGSELEPPAADLGVQVNLLGRRFDAWGWATGPADTMLARARADLKIGELVSTNSRENFTKQHNLGGVHATFAAVLWCRACGGWSGSGASNTGFKQLQRSVPFPNWIRSLW